MTKLIINIYRYIFARPRFENFNRALLHLSLRGLGVLNYETDIVSGERYLITKLLPAIIKKTNPVFLDIGANLGNYSKVLFKQFPNATIHLFEPQINNYNYLLKNFNNINFVHHNLAVGSEVGEIILFDRSDRNGSSHASIYKNVITKIHKTDVVESKIKMTTIDSFVNEQKINNIDYIKIDTEGNELSILKGATEVLNKNTIKCIHFEFNEMNIYSKSFMNDFSEILINFDLYRLLPTGLIKITDKSILEREFFAYQNIIAINKNVKIK